MQQKDRPRALSDPDELFLTLSRMRLNLLEEDLHYTFEVSVTTVSEAFITWTDRLTQLPQLFRSDSRA